MSNYLEIDSKILEKNLLLQNNSTEDNNFDNLFRSPQNYVKENTPWKLVTPSAGFCVKTTDSKNKKVFINICTLDDIPEPRGVTEAELLKLWQSDDVPDYRIPLSIQDPHDEFDKSGNPTVVYDVAINTKFFQKIVSSMIFRSFVMQVVLEGIENKYDVELKKEGFIILQNRKSLGVIKPHRIRTNREPIIPSRPLIEELKSTSGNSGSGDAKREVRETKTPEFRLFKNMHTKFLIGEFHLPKLVTLKNLTLDVSQNRIVLESRHCSFLADIFIPFRIDEAESVARFNSNTKILTLRMPIISTSTELSL